MLKGLLNSSDMEERLSVAAGRSRGQAQRRLARYPPPHLRLHIPGEEASAASGEFPTRLLQERPPSRQRQVPVHLNSEAPQGPQASPDVDRRWAHYSTPRPQSRHKSPPDAVFLDLPPEPLQGDRDPQPLPAEELPPSPSDVADGGGASGKGSSGGAVRDFDIDPTWDKTQIMVWSKDAGKKSFKTNIEILQGPNNQKQHLNLRCGGSTQPYHAVINTPGAGWKIRCNSKKFLEDGLFEIAVAPYGEVGDGSSPGVLLGSGGF